ncbi:MAG: alpha-L-rhamnosidase N-terminal domain-containing protein, partial [Dysgonamonadaceae bacterium]
MKTKNILIALLILFSLSAFPQSACSIFPVNLTCEYLTNPRGLDVLHPRFSWTLKATDENKYGQKQTAYRIWVSNSRKTIDDHKGDMWDTGWVKSDRMQLIEYQGKPLLSDKNYYWKIAVKDENDNESGYSEVVEWSTGLFSRNEWTAKWIGSSQLFDYQKSNGNCNIDDPWLRKTFKLREKPSKATLFVASVGYHEVYVNGKKIGENVLEPAVTDHTKRARYTAYDIANELK